MRGSKQMAQKHSRALCIALGLLSAPVAQAQFGPDGVGLFFPICIALTADSPTTQAYLKKSEDEYWSQLLVGKQHIDQRCTKLLPPKLIKNCEQLLISTNADGTLNEDLYRQNVVSEDWSSIPDDTRAFDACVSYGYSDPSSVTDEQKRQWHLPKAVDEKTIETIKSRVLNQRLTAAELAPLSMEQINDLHAIIQEKHPDANLNILNDNEPFTNASRARWLKNPTERSKLPTIIRHNDELLTHRAFDQLERLQKLAHQFGQRAFDFSDIENLEEENFEVVFYYIEQTDLNNLKQLPAKNPQHNYTSFIESNADTIGVFAKDNLQLIQTYKAYLRQHQDAN